MADPSSVSVIVPAFNEAAVIGDLVVRLQSSARWREVLVIDDGSNDGTSEAARRAGARVVRHPYNKGNGAAVKTGIRHAAAPYILIMDGDGQHSVDDALRVIAPLGEYDLVVGARAPSTQSSSPRRLGNALLNALAGYLTGRPIPDLTSGLRGARRECLREFLHLLPNGFSTPTTTTLAFIRAGYNVAFEPILAQRRVGRSKIRFTRDGASFLLILVKIMTVFSPLRIFVPVSAVSAATGAAYGIVNVVVNGRIPNGAVLLMLFAALVFLVGLVSEQVSLLRFQGPVPTATDDPPAEASRIESEEPDEQPWLTRR